MSENKTPAKKPDIVTRVLSKVNSFREYGELKIPKDFSPENALKSAYLILKDVKDKNNKPAIEACTQESIVQSLMDMVTQGLSPMKKQCSFVVYGNKLTIVREWPGSIALARRWGGVKDVYPYVIYEGDEVIFKVSPETGKRRLVKHEQSVDNIDENKIKGGYAIVTFQDNSESHAEPMSMTQIRTAWNQGASKGQSPAHKNFPSEMAKKTLIHHACKLYFRASDDSIFLDDSNTSGQGEQSQEQPKQANKKAIDFDDIEEAQYDNQPEEKSEPKEEVKQEEQSSNENKQQPQQEKKGPGRPPKNEQKEPDF